MAFLWRLLPLCFAAGAMDRLSALDICIIQDNERTEVGAAESASQRRNKAALEHRLRCQREDGEIACRFMRSIQVAMN